MRYFNTRFLKAAQEYISTLDQKTVRKVLYNIDLAEQTNDRELFKKLTGEIWEFRTIYQGKKIRILAFWDKRDKTNTLVIATQGFTKKVSKVPKSEIDKAERIRVEYFKN